MVYEVNGSFRAMCDRKIPDALEHNVFKTIFIVNIGHKKQRRKQIQLRRDTDVEMGKRENKVGPCDNISMM